MTKREMEMEIEMLRKKKGDLTSAKADIQTSLAEVNAKFVGRLDNRVYEKLQKERAQLCRMQNEIERQIKPVNAEIRVLSIEKDQFEDKSHLSSKPIVEAIVQIRDEYTAFAADKTRVGSMRQMAAEFVTKLNPVIRKAIGTN
jgi:predicted  nucleic acid-binding Zn-ribbon protein